MEVVGDDGVPLVGVNVLVSQYGHAVLSCPTDETGKVTVVGHGQEAPCLVEIEGMAPMIIEGGLEEGDCPLEYEPGEVPAPVEGCDAANAETWFAELEAPPDDLFA